MFVVGFNFKPSTYVWFSFVVYQPMWVSAQYQVAKTYAHECCKDSDVIKTNR